MARTYGLWAALFILLNLTGCIDNAEYGITSDIEGNEYKTIVIGEQEWHAENLRASKFNDGSEIPLITEDDIWSSLTTPGYCWMNHDSAKYTPVYGALYNWHAVKSGKLCPAGWRVASDEDWASLINFLASVGYSGKEGRALKAKTKWQSGSRGNNKYGFNALPGGARYNFTGKFIFEGYNGYWWTSTEHSTEHALYRAIYDGNHNISGDFYHKESGFSVRCIRETD